ncbi:UNKNOWN [Stylonychia lemnae]|uniref:Uncharacterized protein n=1 Tax=Stylonychia lemnae TaxID=5949 RepID=A0A078B322_STYLE|nr:UNKNOWN [Stylonychia lemnae]|eukprot:CDW88666.1 UNKNOWN [Stylonychia lemnae]
MQGMGMPGAMGAPKKKAEVVIPKLIANDKNNRIYQIINKGYALFYIVGSFGKKLLWFTSCSIYLFKIINNYLVAFMFILPMGFEIFSEQSRILAKIQMQMMSESMMGGIGGADMQPQIRPF